MAQWNFVLNSHLTWHLAHSMTVRYIEWMNPFNDVVTVELFLVIVEITIVMKLVWRNGAMRVRWKLSTIEWFGIGAQNSWHTMNYFPFNFNYEQLVRFTNETNFLHKFLNFIWDQQGNLKWLQPFAKFDLYSKTRHLVGSKLKM